MANDEVVSYEASHEQVYDQVEIEDMEFVKDQNKFFYPCPCGDRFEISVVSEAELIL